MHFEGASQGTAPIPPHIWPGLAGTLESEIHTPASEPFHILHMRPCSQRTFAKPPQISPGPAIVSLTHTPASLSGHLRHSKPCWQVAFVNPPQISPNPRGAVSAATASEIENAE